MRDATNAEWTFAVNPAITSDQGDKRNDDECFFVRRAHGADWLVPAGETEHEMGVATRVFRIVFDQLQTHGPERFFQLCDRNAIRVALRV